MGPRLCASGAQRVHARNAPLPIASSIVGRALDDCNSQILRGLPVLPGIHATANVGERREGPFLCRSTTEWLTESSGDSAWIIIVCSEKTPSSLAASIVKTGD